MPKRNFSDTVNDVCKGSPSRIRMVRRISLGITTLPRSSILLTIPVAFILYLSPCFVGKIFVFCRRTMFVPTIMTKTVSYVKFLLPCYCLSEFAVYAIDCFLFVQEICNISYFLNHATVFCSR